MKQPYHEDNATIVIVNEESSTQINDETEVSTDDPLEAENISAVRSATVAKEETAKVDYSGCQLWKVATNKTGVRATLGRLRRRNRKCIILL